MMITDKKPGYLVYDALEDSFDRFSSLPYAMFHAEGAIGRNLEYGCSVSDIDVDVYQLISTATIGDDARVRMSPAAPESGLRRWEYGVDLPIGSEPPAGIYVATGWMECPVIVRNPGDWSKLPGVVFYGPIPELEATT